MSEGSEGSEGSEPALAARPRSRRGARILREVLVAALPALLGYVVAGITGALVAGAAVIAGRLPAEHPGKPVAMAACLLLAAAAVASVLEAVPGERPITLAFPIQRELAGDLGAAAGILLLAAIVTSALAERPLEPPAEPDEAPPGDSLPPWRVSVAAVGVLVVALVVRLVAAPAAVAEGLDPVVAAVAGGRALVVDGVGLVAPAGPILVAFWPGGGSVALVVLGVLVVVLLAVLAERLRPDDGERDGLVVAAVAGGTAALLPSLWLLDLAGALAAAAALVVVLLGDPQRATGWRGVGAGVVAAVGVLARPDAVVLGPVVVVWLLVARRRPGAARRPTRRQVRAAWGAGVAWAGVLVVWTLVVHDQAGGWNPLRGLGPEADGSAGALGVAAVLVLDLVVVVAAVTAVLHRRGHLSSLLPLLVLPAWCVAADLAVGDGGLAGVLGWGAPFVVVLAAWASAAWVGGPVRRLLGRDQSVRTSS